MNPLVISGIVFACTLAGATVGMWLRSRLPEGHLSKDSQDVIRLTAGLIGSMAALVLGLLVASATGEFNDQKTGFQQLAANIVLLDRALIHYGPDAASAREALRASTKQLIDGLWPPGGGSAMRMDSADLTIGADQIYAAIRDLNPRTDAERETQARALSIGAELSKTRWQLSESEDSSLPTAFFVVLAFWLTGLFLSFGLFAPRNGTVIFALLVSAASVAGAVLLVVDLAQPFGGLIQLSSTPLRSSLEQLGR